MKKSLLITEPHLLQEAHQEVPGGGVVGEEAEDGFMQHVGVEAAAGGRQRSESPEDEARLLPRHRLLYLLHMLLNVWGGQKGQESDRSSFIILHVLDSV